MEDIKILYLKVNQNCNAHCFMCDFWKNSNAEIMQKQFEDILSRIGKVKMIRFTGGEPLLCKKISEYIYKCHLLGVKTSIITNGLILNEKIDELVKSGLDQIIISIDGSIGELHDTLRGVNGLLEKIDIALKNIREKYPSLHIRVNTVVSEKNISNLSDLAFWLEERNVKSWSIIPVKLEGYKWSEKMSFEDFERNYCAFKKAINKCKIHLLGYSANWAGDLNTFWKENVYIRPKGICCTTQKIAFYDPFMEHIYPCNCIPHRKKYFENEVEEKEWYFLHGHEYCMGCEPLNAYCADFPRKIDEDIFNF